MPVFVCQWLSVCARVFVRIVTRCVCVCFVFHCLCVLCFTVCVYCVSVCVHASVFISHCLALSFVSQYVILKGLFVCVPLPLCVCASICVCVQQCGSALPVFVLSGLWSCYPQYQLHSRASISTATSPISILSLSTSLLHFNSSILTHCLDDQLFYCNFFYHSRLIPLV